MQFQSNPYLIWQLIPGAILLGIGLYVQSRPVKKRESLMFSLLMFSGSLWAFANAIQLITPNVTWQIAWNRLTYLGIMVVPTSWFLLSIKLTGIFRDRVEKFEKYLWIPPALLYAILLSSTWHRTFFTSVEMVTVGGYVTLVNSFGPLFYVHTIYSYGLIVSGIVILVASLLLEFRKYGVQAYGLLIGVLAPLIGNAYFLFGSPPAGFPDPTPIIFTVTGIAFAWAIFGGRILEVVPLAHEAIVRRLSAGVLILDAEKNIRDINDAARSMLGLKQRAYAGDSLDALVEENRDIALRMNEALEASIEHDQHLQLDFQATERTFDIHISHLGEGAESTTGWLIQFTDVSEQKQTEESLAAAQTTLRSILNTLQDGYFEADRDGNLIYANKTFYQTLGFSKLEELQGKNFRNFTSRENVREIYERFNRLYETKEPLETFDYHYRTKDGELYIGETTVSPIMNGDEVIGSRGLIRDITDRVNAENEILRQKDLLDNLLKQSPIAMVINDKLNRITMVNPAFEKLFGFTQPEILGKKLEEILPAGQSNESQEPRISNTSVMKSTSYVRKRRTKDGKMLDVEIFNTPFHVGGERFGYLVFYNDITQRLKTQADLEKSQKSYFAVLETLQDPYFESLPSGYLIYVNDAFARFSGYEKGEIIGSHFRNFASTKSIRATLQHFKSLYATARPAPPFEFIYRRKDGMELPSEMAVSPIIEDGKVVGARGIIRDISVRVEAEKLLKQAKDAAESRAGELSAINRVASTVSQSLDYKDVLQAVCQELTAIFDIRNAGIGLLTPDRLNLEIAAFHAVDPDEKSVLGLQLPVEGNASSQEVIRKKKTVVIQDAQSDSRTSSIADLSRERGTKSIMIVPLLARGEVIGTIGMPAMDPDHIFSDNEIQLAETIASQIATALENARLYAETESALGVAERDLEIGRQIQSGFFPEQLPTLQGWEIAAHFHAARQVAGDFYDVFQLKDSKLTAFIVADVCDKGVGAALFMVLFRSLLRAFSGMKTNANNVGEQLLRIIQNTNDFIAEYHGKSNMFATLFFGVLDPDTGTLHYVNGGHEPPVILNQKGSIVQRLMPTGPAVGMFPGMDFRVERIQIDPGDYLVGFTDGVTDAKNASGAQYTEDRLLETLSNPWTSTFSLLYELNSEILRHIGGQNQFDDITLVSFRRIPEEQKAQHAICRKADLQALDELRGFVESAGRYCGLTADDVFPFKLAVDEICVNIIQYGYEGREPGNLSLFFDVIDETVRLTIHDDGRYFSPDQAKSPDLEAGWEEREIGGLGLFFVKELMDNVTYNRHGNKLNQYILEKKLGYNKVEKER